MAYVPLPEVSKLIEVYSSKNDFNEKDHESDISEDIQKLKNEKGHNQKDVGNMEENLKNVSDILSNEENCSDQDLNEFSKEMELKINKRYCNADNSNNTVKKRFFNLVASGSVEDISLCKTNKIFSNTDNEYHSGSLDTDLQITEHNNLKYKNLNRIIDSKSEDIQIGKSNNFPQMIHDTLNTIAESCQTSMHFESGEEKQSEKTESKKDTSKNNNLSQKIQDTISTTVESYWALIDSESEEEKETENDTLITSKETSDSKDITKKSVKKKKSSIRALIDSESEEEKETENDTLITSKETSDSKDITKKSVKKKKSSIRASRDEAMRQVHSKSQHLLREIEISLPYHKPKQRTLQEFLNRKKILAALPKASSTSAKLKMSSVIVSQVLAEKEKEAELFYKSSDSENDVQQSMPLVSKDIKKSSITNEKESSINIDHIYIKSPKKIKTSTQDSQDKKEIVQKDYLNLNAPRYQILFEQDIREVPHQVVKLSSLTNNNSNLDDEFDVLLPQTTNEYNQNVSKFNLPRKLFDSHFENGSNDSSEMNLGEQRATKGVVETFLNKEKCIDEKMLISMTENQTSKMHQDDSKIINRRNKNLVTGTMKVSEILSNSINSKEITETFQSDNDVSDNVINLKSDCIITQNRNNEKKDSEINDVLSLVINDAHLKIQDNPSTDKCEKFNHIQGLLPFPEITEKTLANRKKLSLSNSKITLRGSPGMIIDLTDEKDAKLNVKGVNTLLDRFFCKHVNTEKQSDKSEVTVVHLQNTQNSLLPIKEVLPYKVSVNTNNSELNKPGAKLKRLKEDLKLQMILKRNKEWKQKEINLQVQKEWNREKKNDYDLDEEEKGELDFELSDSEESEPEENDVCIEDKKRSKRLFADDEAEVTDNEDSSTEETCNESDTDHVKSSKPSKQSISFEYRKAYVHDDVSEIETDDEDKDEDEEDDEDKDEDEEEGNKNLDTNTENGNESDFKDDDNVNVCKSFSSVKNKNDRKMKQLIEEFQDDSINTNPSYLRNNNNQLNMVTDIHSKIYCEDNDWISENESNMPACQQYGEIATRNQICKTPLTKTSMLDLISPITQLSVLNITLDSNKKDLSQKREDLVDKHEFLSIENTQNESSERVCNIINKSILKKKLFDDIGEIIDDEYLMRLCSGKFESTQKTDLDLFSQSNITESQLRPSESELCPGNSNVIIDIKQSTNPKVNDKMLQDIKLTLDEDSNNSVNHAREIKKVTAIDSELKLKVTSSDDDNEDTFLKPVKKRSTKRLNLSDSEEENFEFTDEENDDVSKEETEEQYINYDSEENEVIIVPEKDIKKIAADFLEEEAELSESDWDSTDEDEKDLDKLEFEEADDEHIDEHEIKNQLGKIHMKQVLDEDKREVRLLKELLFEDGDLHTDGTGRERKFKWKNIDKLGNNIEIPQISENDGWVDVPEDEEEAKWSKFRHERDKFLEERMKCLNNEIEDELCDSQIFKLGLEAVRKIKDNESQRQDTSFDKVDLSENMEPIMPRNITDFLNRPNIGKKSQMICNVIKKRSLLTRGEKSLARIASLAKQGDSASHVANTRNFVFPHIDHNINNTFKKENELITEDLDSQIIFRKPGKRKMISNMSSTSKKRRK